MKAGERKHLWRGKLHQKRYSLIRNFNVLIVLLTVLLLINLFLGISSMISFRDHNEKQIEKILGAYRQKQEERLEFVRHYVEWSAVHEPLLRDLMKHTGAGKEVQDLLVLRSRVRDMKNAYGAGVMFFAYLEGEEKFYHLSEVKIPYEDYLELRKRAPQKARKEGQKMAWQRIRLGQDRKSFLFYGVSYRGVYVCGLVDAEKLRGNLDDIITGRKGYYRLLDEEGREFLRVDGSGGSLFPLFYRNYTLQADPGGMPYQVQVHADVYSAAAEQEIRQSLILLLLFVVLFVAARYIYVTNRSVLRPLENFQIALKNVSAEDSILHMESPPLRELEPADQQLKNLVSQLQKMRISVYEEELERKKFEITFLQHQIRPHFYLNCLATIDSMAQLGEIEELRKMVLFTSQYIRYLFQVDSNLVRLSYELTHIEAYLDIQNLRMEENFEVEVKAAPEAMEACIPPLFLISFVENSVKHASVSAGEKLKISIHCRREKERLVVDIEDSGQGFPPEFLREQEGELPLAEGKGGEPLVAERKEEPPVAKRREEGAAIGEKREEGSQIKEAVLKRTHIGIANSRKRLALLYGRSYRLVLLNLSAPAHGAVVHVEIPFEQSSEKAVAFD
ncbi:MAG: histidine kinase [Lachnospiraceae bacterium]|nr:histidine kinase [Lachnospiraceae bacterium]